MELYIAVNPDESPIYFNREFNPNDFIVFTGLGELFDFVFDQEFKDPSEYVYYVYYDILNGKHINSGEDIYRKYLGDDWYQTIGIMRDRRRGL